MEMSLDGDLIAILGIFFTNKQDETNIELQAQITSPSPIQLIIPYPTQHTMKRCQTAFLWILIPGTDHQP